MYAPEEEMIRVLLAVEQTVTLLHIAAQGSEEGGAIVIGPSSPTTEQHLTKDNRSLIVMNLTLITVHIAQSLRTFVCIEDSIAEPYFFYIIVVH